MKLTKTLSKLCSNHMVIFTVLAALVLIYFIHLYSGKKSITLSGMVSQIKGTGGVSNGNMMNPREAQGVDNQAYGDAGCCGPPQMAVPSDPLGQNSGPAGVNGIQTEMHGLPSSCSQKSVTDPRNLLPRDENNEFSKMNPVGAGDVANVSLLKAGFHIGIDTVGQSLRNANLQIRSEPANPQLDTGPWNTSTIGPDVNRRSMEIGCGPN